MPFLWGSALNNQTVLCSINARTQLVKLVANSLNTVSFLYPQLSSPSNHSLALSQHSCHSQNRNFVNKARHNIRPKAGAMKLRTAYQNISHWLAATVALVLQGNICPHSLQHIQYASTGRINAHILQQQFAMRNYRSSHQPESSRTNISRHHYFLWGN